MIEIPHQDDPGACDRATRLVLEHGSHLITNVDLGCKDGVHKAWIIIEGDSKDEIRLMLPPVYRPEATITRLTKFSLEDINKLTELHR